MRDSDCVEFLQWALPGLRMRWAGFRKVRGQVCKRLTRRLAELGLANLHAYREHLEASEEEWATLDSLCRITISRFYRDRGVWNRIREVVLPELAEVVRRRGETAIRCCSIGCASGEEPYTLAMISQGQPALRILAIDADEHLLARAREGLYESSSLRDLPPEMRGCFSVESDRFRLRESFRENVEFARLDARERLPEGPFHLVLCRNLVFTYYEESLQRAILERLLQRMDPEGVLVVGVHERLPAGSGLTVKGPTLGIHYRRAEA